MMGRGQGPVGKRKLNQYHEDESSSDDLGSNTSAAMPLDSYPLEDLCARCLTIDFEKNFQNANKNMPWLIHYELRRVL